MRYRNLPFIVLVLAFMLGSIGVRVSATGSPPSIAAIGVAVEILDDNLNDRVETLLRTDIGLVGARFRVHTENAVVVIAGTVPDEFALYRAIELASGIKGVREVHNAMEIEDPK
jgi:hyperosmotically inducible periplasmic protein